MFISAMNKLYLLLWLMTSPHFTENNFVCSKNEFLDDYLNDKWKYSEKTRSEKIIQFQTYKKTGRNLAEMRSPNESFSEDAIFEMRMSDLVKSLTEMDSINTVLRFKNWYVPRFLQNDDVLLIDFRIPEGTREAIFLFYAYELKFNNVGGDCKPRPIELILKPLGIPISNISMPENFRYYRNYSYSEYFESNNVVHAIKLEYPYAGDWYVRVYRSWTDPKDDVVEQKGTTAKCDTLLSGQVSVDVEIISNFVNCFDVIDITLQPTDTLLTDYYKCFINREMLMLDINIAFHLSNETEFVTLRIDGKKLANENSPFQCDLIVEEELNKEITVEFTPYIHEWHYLQIVYGKNSSKPLSSKKKCENIQYNTSIKTTISRLIRQSSPSSFSFEYISIEPTLSLVLNELHTLRFDILSTKDMGGILSIEMNILGNETVMDVIFCIGLGKIMAPTADKTCKYDLITIEPHMFLSNNGDEKMSGAIHIPFPEVGTWYITMGVFEDETDKRISNLPFIDSSDITEVDVRITSNPCSAKGCGPFGTCQIAMAGTIVFAACKCDYGFTGLLCSDDAHVLSKGESLIEILLLTLSNLFFIPSIVFAIRREYYTEALVYTFSMFFSTFYHACDSTNVYFGLCIAKFEALQYADFFCGLLAFWVTLVAMADLNNTHVSVLHAFGTILIAFGTELDRFSLVLFLLPMISGFVIILMSWLIHWKLSGHLFPGKIYLMYFFPGGLLLVTVGLVCFAFLQTLSNYHIVHSLWHITVALCILLLLPIRKYFIPYAYSPIDTINPFALLRS